MNHLDEIALCFFTERGRDSAKVRRRCISFLCRGRGIPHRIFLWRWPLGKVGGVAFNSLEGQGIMYAFSLFFFVDSFAFQFLLRYRIQQSPIPITRCIFVEGVGLGKR